MLSLEYLIIPSGARAAFWIVSIPASEIETNERYHITGVDGLGVSLGRRGDHCKAKGENWYCCQEPIPTT